MSKIDSLFRAKNGGATMIASGSIIPMDNSPTDIEIPIGLQDSLTLRVSLESSKEEMLSGGWKLNLNKEKPSFVEIVLVNIESPLGGGPAKPIPLWVNENSTILCALRLYTQGDSPPTIHFSFFSKPNEVSE